jgi:hypothetical protein
VSYVILIQHRTFLSASVIGWFLNRDTVCYSFLGKNWILIRVLKLRRCDRTCKYERAQTSSAATPGLRSVRKWTPCVLIAWTSGLKALNSAVHVRNDRCSEWQLLLCNIGTF